MNAYDELFAYAREHNPELYERVLLEDYVEENGAHYNEKYARDAVSRMSHKNADGTTETGEHWTFEQVMQANAANRAKLPQDVTDWEVYVAANMWWHDLGENYRRRSSGNVTAQIMDDCTKWSFLDDDAPDGKLWKHLHAMR